MSATQTLLGPTAHAEQPLHATSTVRGFLCAILAIRSELQAMVRRTMTLDRLGEHLRRDVGLSPEQSPDEPIWGQAGIMWRP